jgi:hypothetical protein
MDSIKQPMTGAERARKWRELFPQTLAVATRKGRGVILRGHPDIHG